MAQITKSDIYAYVGSSKTFTFTCTQGGSAKSWASATAVTMSIKKKLSDTTALISMTATDGVNGNSFSTGVLVFVMTATNAALLVPNCVYDVKLVPSGGTNRAICYGDVLIQANVG